MPLTFTLAAPPAPRSSGFPDSVEVLAWRFSPSLGLADVCLPLEGCLVASHHEQATPTQHFLPIPAVLKIRSSRVRGGILSFLSSYLFSCFFAKSGRRYIPSLLLLENFKMHSFVLMTAYFKPFYKGNNRRCFRIPATIIL